MGVGPGLVRTPAWGLWAHGASTMCRHVPRHIIVSVLQLLPHNDFVLNGRLVCQDAAQSFSDPEHRTVRLSEPLSEHADQQMCILGWRNNLCHLTFLHKLRLPAIAAASGSEANLAIAWALLQPSLFDELCPGIQNSEQGIPISPYFQYGAGNHMDWYPESPCDLDPGAAALEAGHQHLLSWLLRHRVPLDPGRTLAAAARHCSLAGLQAVSELLLGRPPGEAVFPVRALDHPAAARAAVQSRSPDAAAKAAWLCGQAPNSEEAHLAAAMGAAEAGDVELLRCWPFALDLPHVLQLDKGCKVLGAALGRSSPATADFLVDEAGCRLPAEEDYSGRADVWIGAAGGGSVEAMRWLRERGVALPDESCRLMLRVAETGQLDAVRFLHEGCGVQLDQGIPGAARSGSIPLVTFMLGAGARKEKAAYHCAALGGHADMLRWLAQEARVPFSDVTARDVINRWPRYRDSSSSSSSSSSSAELLGAVQGLLDAGCPLGRAPCSLLDQASRRGDLPLVRYLHQQRGVGFGEETLAGAAGGGCEAVLEWLWEAGCRAPLVEDTETADEYDPYAAAGQHGDLGTLRYLSELEVPYEIDTALEWALGKELMPLPLRRCFVEHQAPELEEEQADSVAFYVADAVLDKQFKDSVDRLMAHPGVGRDLVRKHMEGEYFDADLEEEYNSYPC